MLSSRIEINADNEANYVVKVDGVDISPNPVVRGKPATFTISASTGNFPFLQFSNRLCLEFDIEGRV